MARAEDSHILLRGHVCCTEASVIPHPRSHFSDLLKQKLENSLSLSPKNKKAVTTTAFLRMPSRATTLLSQE